MAARKLSRLLGRGFLLVLQSGHKIISGPRWQAGHRYHSLILGEHVAWIIPEFKRQGNATNVVGRDARRRRPRRRWWMDGWMVGWLDCWIAGLIVLGCFFIFFDVVLRVLACFGENGTNAKHGTKEIAGVAA